MNRLALTSLLVGILLTPSFVLAEEQETKSSGGSSIVINGTVMRSNAMFNSVAGLTMIQGSIGYERELNESYSFRVSLAPVYQVVSPESNFGMGGDLGLVAYLGERSENHFYYEFGGGMVFFAREFPRNRTNRFNFTLFAGIGAVVPLNRREEMLFGYRFYHVSNSAFGEFNPGVNANQFLVGYKRKF